MMEAGGERGGSKPLSAADVGPAFGASGQRDPKEGMTGLTWIVNRQALPSSDCSRLANVLFGGKGVSFNSALVPVSSSPS